ncbi:MAG: F0F1 ATP synthase subunit epsilon [Anaeroplasmataceae bacterium]|nr:F0F1 ATP synthase subunit epsilon [Anaeroplasmataceae bacterium]
MKILVSTHQGRLYDEVVDYVVVHNTDGEFAIMNNHVPVVAVMDEGYVKLVRNQEEYFVAIVNGILEFHDNVVSVLAQEAHIGTDKSSAKVHLEEFRNERLNQNRKEQVDFTQKERELREHLKNSKAGQL